MAMPDGRGDAEAEEPEKAAAVGAVLEIADGVDRGQQPQHRGQRQGTGPTARRPCSASARPGAISRLRPKSAPPATSSDSHATSATFTAAAVRFSVCAAAPVIRHRQDHRRDTERGHQDGKGQKLGHVTVTSRRARGRRRRGQAPERQWQGPERRHRRPARPDPARAGRHMRPAAQTARYDAGQVGRRQHRAEKDKRNPDARRRGRSARP